MPKIVQTIQVHAPALHGRTLTCTYTVDEEHFTTAYDFPATPVHTDSEQIRKLSQWVAIVSSFTYFNVAYFDVVSCDFPLTDQDSAFFEKLIRHGLGEFRLVNGIGIERRTSVRGRGAIKKARPLSPGEYHGANGPLLMNGGGKDGSVSAKLLTSTGVDFTWFQRGDSQAQRNVVAVWDAPAFIIRRRLDPKGQNRKFSGAHRPLSAYLAFLSVLTACLFDYSDTITSNEASANEPTLQAGGFSVNHQYSKSFEFEQDVQALLLSSGVTARYFSLLRPLHELQIAFLAAELSTKQLRATTSCNHGTSNAVWCFACAKCAFLALIMTATDRGTATKVWGNESVLDQPALRPFLVELLDPNADKPLECVGTLAECQIAAGLIVDRTDNGLNETTSALLAKYARRPGPETEKFLHSLDVNAIPSTYQPVFDKLRSLLAQIVV